MSPETRDPRQTTIIAVDLYSYPPRSCATTMNSALDNLYEELLRNKVDDGEEPEEELTDAEKAKRFLEEKRVAIDKLKEASMCIELSPDYSRALYYS